MRNPHLRNIGVIIILTALAYAGSLSGRFIFDDHPVITRNSFITSWKNLPRLASASYLTKNKDLDFVGFYDIGSGESSYRPAVTLTYFIDYGLFGRRPFGYHLVNLLLHLGSCILLYFFMFDLTQSRSGAFVAALLFGLHPAAAEAVSVISFREDLLVGFFVLVALLAHRRFNETGGWKQGVAWLGLAAALLSKESAAVLPLLLLAHDYLFYPGKGLRKRILVHAGYWLILAGYIWLRFLVFVNPDAAGFAGPLKDIVTRVCTMAGVFLLYLRWAFFPAGIHPAWPDYSRYAVHSPGNPAALVGIVLFVAACALPFYLKRRRPVLSFALIWFVVFLLPVSNILFPLAYFIAGRYLYVSLIGLGITIGYLYGKIQVSRQVAVAAVVIFLPLTMVRTLDYRADRVFLSRLVKDYPQQYKLRVHLGDVLFESGQLDRALAEYDRAVSLRPDFAKAYNGRGRYYYSQGLFGPAVTEFSQAVARNPSLVPGYVNLGAALSMQGRYIEGIDAFKRAIALNPRYVLAYDGLGITYVKMASWEQARSAWEAALKINPLFEPARVKLKSIQAKFK